MGRPRQTNPEQKRVTTIITIDARMYEALKGSAWKRNSVIGAALLDFFLQAPAGQSERIVRHSQFVANNKERV